MNSIPEFLNSLCEELYLGPGDGSRLDALDLVGGGGQFAVGVRLIRADGDDRERRPLPQVVVLDFGDRDVELLSRSFTRRSTERLSFSDCAPGTWSSTVSKPTIIFLLAPGPHPSAGWPQRADRPGARAPPRRDLR